MMSQVYQLHTKSQSQTQMRTEQTWKTGEGETTQKVRTGCQQGRILRCRVRQNPWIQIWIFCCDWVIQQIQLMYRAIILNSIRPLSNVHIQPGFAVLLWSSQKCRRALFPSPLVWWWPLAGIFSTQWCHSQMNCCIWVFYLLLNKDPVLVSSPYSPCHLFIFALALFSGQSNGPSKFLCTMLVTQYNSDMLKGHGINNCHMDSYHQSSLISSITFTFTALHQSIWKSVNDVLYKTQNKTTHLINSKLSIDNTHDLNK